MTNIYFLILIISTGALSIYTDLRERKIKNLHLLIICILAIIFYRTPAVLKKSSLSIFSLLNPFIAIGLSFVFYLTNQWKAGDAKLYCTYSLLLPVNNYSSLLPFSCLVLLFNTFLMGSLFVIPLFIKEIISQKERVSNVLPFKKLLLDLLNIFMVTLGVTWVIYPIVNSFLPRANVILNFVLVYIAYSVIYRFTGRLKKDKWLLVFIFATGLIARYICMPDSLSALRIIYYLRHLLSYSLIFYMLRIISQSGKKQSGRIPLAPFLFLGALLSNTGFLWLVISAVARLR